MISINKQDDIGSVIYNRKNIGKIVQNNKIIWDAAPKSCFGTGRWLDNCPWTDNLAWKDK